MVLFLPGVKSTQGVTCNRSTGEVTNHIYPDVDYTDGIELMKVKESKYKENHVGKTTKSIPSPQFPEKFFTTKIIKEKKW